MTRPYQTKVVRIGIVGQGKINRLVAQGWEVVHSKGGQIGTGQTVTLRRLKPRYADSATAQPPTPVPQSSLAAGNPDTVTSEVSASVQAPDEEVESERRGLWSKLHRPGRAWYLQPWVWILGALLIIGLLGQVFGSGEKDSESAAPAIPEASDESSNPVGAEEPAEAEEPEAEEPVSEIPSDEEVVAAFRDHIDERSNSGVLLASAVSDVSFQDGTVIITFDPTGQGLNSNQWDVAVSVFDNVAEFVGSPVMFSDDEGKRLRTVVEQVVAVFSDGSSLGSLSKAELYQLGTGEAYVEGD